MPIASLIARLLGAPIAGPKAFADAKQAPQRVTAVARRSEGQEAITSPMEAGVISAAPTPWKPLITTRKRALGETAMPTEAATNTINPIDRTRSLPVRSASRPLTTNKGGVHKDIRIQNP